MVAIRYVKTLVFLGFIALGAIGARCEAPELLPPDTNRPPETTLTRGPGQDEQTHYRVRLYWSGFDPDGTVSQWQYAIDDTVVRPDAEIVGTGWIKTTKTDSLFIFRASDNGFNRVLDHTFFIASIDNEGKTDPTPSVLDFRAETTAYPIPRVEVGPTEGDTLPPFATVELCWGGVDPDGEIVTMSYGLDPYQLGLTTVDFNENRCVTYENLPPNPSRQAYRFLLQAEDDAGSRNPVPIERAFVVNHDPDTEIVLFLSEWIRPLDRENLNFLPIVPGQTIADSSRVTFRWEATDPDGDAIAGAFFLIEGVSTGTIFSSTELAANGVAREARVPSNAQIGTVDAPWITSDLGGGARLIVGSIDEHGRVEGTPDTIAFDVNFPPNVRITEPTGISITLPSDTLRVAWQGGDPDGSTSQLEYDVKLQRQGGTTRETRVQAGFPSFLLFPAIQSGSYLISITPVDRAGGIGSKLGETAQKQISVNVVGGPRPEGSGAKGGTRQ